MDIMLLDCAKNGFVPAALVILGRVPCFSVSAHGRWDDRIREWEAACAESGKGLAELDHLGRDGRRRLVRLVVSRPRVLDQARWSLLLEATEPLPDRGRGCGEQARG